MVNAQRGQSAMAGLVSRRVPLKEAGLSDATRRAVRLWQTDGPARLANIALRLAASPLLEFGHLAFFARELDAEVGWPKLPSGLEIRRAISSDLPKLVSAGRADATLAEERFQRGDQCLVVVDAEGAVLHNRWITVIPTPIPELQRNIWPQRDEAYFYDGYTRREARSLGLDGAVRCYIFEALRAAGFRRVYSYVRGDNRPGLRAAARWQTAVGEVTFLRLRGLGAWILSRRDTGDPHSRSPWPELR
jgi:hypothetical protein